MWKQKYLNDNLGTFAIKLALLAPLLLLDTSRLVSAKQKLQFATDSSALSTARAYQLGNTDFNTEAKTFLAKTLMRNRQSKT